MNTKVRFSKGRSGNYDTLEMQIIEVSARLVTKWIGTIHWQGDSTHGWYGLRYEISASANEYKNIFAMYKIASYIQDRTSYNSTPQEVVAVIGGIEHFYLHGEYVSIQDNGKQLYEVIKDSTNTLQTVITAANELMAFRIIEGMIKRKELANETYRLKPRGSRLALCPTNLDYFATTSQKTTTN